MSQNRQVVVAFDFTAHAEAALDRAASVAARAPEHVLHVITAIGSGRELVFGEQAGVVYESPADQLHVMIKERVALALAGHPTTGEVQFFAHARVGKPAQEILDLAEEVGADLIFIGSHGHTGVSRLLLGSVSEKVVRGARCPVMVVRPKSYTDVELEKVVAYEHDRATYVPPHRYTYADNRVIARPGDWPFGGS